MKSIATLTFALALTLQIAACAATDTEANKEIVRRMAAAVNERNFDALDELIAEDVHRHSGATPQITVESLDQFKEFLRQDLSAVPDAVQEINFMLAESDLVAVHATYRGTQSGQMGPFPPSDNSLELPFIGILRIQDGKIAEMWVEWDNLNALMQLGHFPPAAAAETDATGRTGQAPR